MKMYYGDGLVEFVKCCLCGNATENEVHSTDANRLAVYLPYMGNVLQPNVAHESCIALALRAQRTEITETSTKGEGMKSYSTKGAVVELKCFLCNGDDKNPPTVLFDGRPAHENCVLDHLKVWDENDPMNPDYKAVLPETRNELAKKKQLKFLKMPWAAVFSAGKEKLVDIEACGGRRKEDLISNIKLKLEDDDEWRVDAILSGGKSIVEWEVRRTVEVWINGYAGACRTDSAGAAALWVSISGYPRCGGHTAAAVHIPRRRRHPGDAGWQGDHTESQAHGPRERTLAHNLRKERQWIR